MAGLYLHIPFCKQACHYCDFHFSTSGKLTDAVVAAMVKEMEMYAAMWSGETFETVYFGGGTPSLLTESQLSAIMQTVYALYKPLKDAEITLEANPDDINWANLQMWRELGVNRLSIGVQSFRDSDLVLMNRAHKATEAVQAIRLAKEAGFEALTADLIYALPGMTEADWVANVDQLLAMQLPHFSAYCLTVEEKTALHSFIRKGKLKAVADEVAGRHFELLMDMAASHGYEHYEISNFAKAGWRAKHNSNYWTGNTYLGIGPSAHSFDGHKRWWNIANNPAYLKALQSGVSPAQMEDLTVFDRFNEYVLTALRRIEGISLLHIESHFGERWLRQLELNLKEIDRNWYVLQGDNLKLSRAGKHFADAMAAELFILADDFI